MASGFPAGPSATMWMPRTSLSLRHWWHWTSVTFKSMIWQEERWLGWGHLLLSLPLALILALLWHPTSLLVFCSVAKCQHTPSSNGCWEDWWSWRRVLIMKVEWCWCRWNGMKVTRSSWFDVSFSDGLGNQWPAITQAYLFITELSLCSNQANGSWQCEHSISCLTWAQYF